MSPSLTVSWSPTPSFDRSYFDGDSTGAAWQGAEDKSASEAEASFQTSVPIPYFDGNTPEAQWTVADSRSPSLLTIYDVKTIAKHHDGISDWTVKVEGASQDITEGSPGVPSADFTLTATPDSIMLGQESLTIEHDDYGNFPGVSDTPTVAGNTVAVSLTSILKKLNAEVFAPVIPSTRNASASETGTGFNVSYDENWNHWDFDDYGVDFKIISVGAGAYGTFGLYCFMVQNTLLQKSIAIFSANGALLYNWVPPVEYGDLLAFHSNGAFMVAMFRRGADYFFTFRSLGQDQNGLNMEEFNRQRYGSQADFTLPDTGFSMLQGLGNIFPFGPDIYLMTTTGVSSQIRKVTRTYNGSEVTSATSSVYISGLGLPEAMYMNAFANNGILLAVSDRLGSNPGIKIYKNGTFDRTAVPASAIPARVNSLYCYASNPTVATSPTSIEFTWQGGQYDFLYNAPGSNQPYTLIYGRTNPAMADAIYSRDFLTVQPRAVFKSGSSRLDGNNQIEHIISRVRPFTGVLVARNFDEFAFSGRYPAWRDTPWNRLNQLTAVAGLQVAQVDNYISVFASGSNADAFILDNIALTSYTVNTDGAFRFVDVEYLNRGQSRFKSINGLTNVMWDAFTADRTFSIAVGETKTETIDTTNYASYVDPLIRTATYQQLRSGPYYMLIGSDNLPVQLNQFEAYGGSVTVKINEESPGAFDIVMVGPSSEIPGVAGPYTIGVSDSSVTRGALTITGNGTYTSPEVLHLSTGANWDYVTQESSGQATANPYVDTLEDAYTHGLRAAAAANGISPRISATIPYTDSRGFVATVGTEVIYMGARWRISDATFTEPEVQIELVQITRVEDFEDAWEGKTVAEFEEFWEGYQVKDFQIAPLRLPE